MAEIRIAGLGVTFDDGTRALDGVDLEVADGELLVLVGPSGCGKSTLLRCVAGLQDPSEGTVEIGGRDVTWASPRERDIAMVFQSYALYPHLSVRDNLAFGLRLRGVGKAERHARAEEVAGLLGIAETLDRRPRALSGGQRQRVAMGRAIVRDPGAFLMDEPLSNLDAKLRSEMRSQITLLQKQLGATMLYVTHDQVEAMTMGDRVAVMRDGRIVQLAAPAELYHRPATTYVAAFIGSPPMNLAPARVLDGGALELTPSNVLRTPSATLNGRVDVTVGIRPEHFRPPQDGDERMTVTPVLVEDLGFAIDVLFEPKPDVRFTARLPAGTRAAEGVPVELGVPRDCIRLFDARSGEAVQ